MLVAFPVHCLQVCHPHQNLIFTPVSLSSIRTQRLELLPATTRETFMCRIHQMERFYISTSPGIYSCLPRLIMEITVSRLARMENYMSLRSKPPKFSP